jgi:hypothetical protein
LLQDRPLLQGKPLLRNALDQKLACCLQDRTNAAPGHAGVASAGSRQQPAGGIRDTSASNLDGASATSARCPSRSGGILHPCEFGRDDIQRDAVADTLFGRKPIVAAGTATVETPAGNNGTGERQTKHGTPSSVILKTKCFRGERI